LAPILEEVAREMPDAKIVKVNVDQNRELAIRYRVSTIPRLLVFRNGHLASQHNGFADKTTIIQLLE
jgi:thioredoxin 1